MRIPYNYTYLAIGAVLFLSFSLVHADDRNKAKSAPASHPASAPAVHAAPSGGGGGHAAPASKPAPPVRAAPTSGGGGGHAAPAPHSAPAVHAAPTGGGGGGVHAGTPNTSHPSTGGGGGGVHAGTPNTSHPTTGGGGGIHAGTPNTSHPSTGHPTTGGGGGVHAGTPNTGHPTTGGGGGIHAGTPNTGHPITGGGPGGHVPPGITRGPNGKVATFHGKNGSEAHFAKNGSVSSVKTHGMTVVHGPHGVRCATSVRGDHTRIVSNGAKHGYVQHPFSYHGHEYARRTYYSGGHIHSSFYRSYSYHGMGFAGYAPYHYYSPGFYGWAYHPWARPVYWGGWGWAGSPWYGYYGGYFAPWTVYPGPAFWLTDYLIATSLQDAYQQQVDAQAQLSADNGGTPLSADVKQLIANEVQSQIALENSEQQQVAQNVEPDPASSGLPRMLADGISHVFVVSNTLDVSDSTGQSCEVTEGDVLQLQVPVPQDASAGSLNVLASKGQDCSRGAAVTVAFDDLQEMQNHMRELIDSGLDQLHAQAGQGGLPAAPPGTNAPPVQSAFAPIAPPPDPNVAGELSQQAADAAAAEQQVVSDANAAGNQ